MRKLLCLLALLTVAPMWAANYFVSQSGSGLGNGSSAGNAASVGTANTHTLAPDDVLLMIGTISSQVIVHDSGTSGHYIKYVLTSGAKMSAPIWGNTTDAAINFNGKNYIWLDGGNGIIESTGNGTTLANQLDNTFIYCVGSSNIIIQNLTMQNMYARTAYSTTDANRYGIAIQGGLSNNIQIDNCIISGGDTPIGLTYGTGSFSTWVITNNTITNCNHAIAIACSDVSGVTLTGVTIANNIINDLDKWGPISSNHLDGIFVFNNTFNTDVVINNLYIHDNTIGPNIGTVWNTGGIFIDVYDPAQIVNMRIYNNLMTAAIGQNWANGFFVIGGCSNSFIVHNTCVSLANGSAGSAVKFDQKSTNLTHEDNLYYYVGTGINMSGSTAFPTGLVSDRNIYWSTGSDWVGPPNLFYHPLSAWRTISGVDALSTESQPLLDASYIPMAADTVARGKGVSFSFRTTAKNGVALPSSPDIGAYQYSSGGDVTNPTVVITLPTTGATYSTNVQALALAGGASDNVAVSSVAVVMSGATVGSVTISGTTAWTGNTTINPGVTVFTATATDSSGNVSTPVTLTATCTLAASNFTNPLKSGIGTRRY